MINCNSIVEKFINASLIIFIDYQSTRLSFRYVHLSFRYAHLLFQYVHLLCSNFAIISTFLYMMLRFSWDLRSTYGDLTTNRVFYFDLFDLKITFEIKKWIDRLIWEVWNKFIENTRFTHKKGFVFTFMSEYNMVCWDDWASPTEIWFWYGNIELWQEKALRGLRGPFRAHPPGKGVRIPEWEVRVPERGVRWLIAFLFDV